MHGNWREPVSQSKSRPVSSVSEENSSGKSVINDSEWFAEMAQSLLAKPGLELHLITGLDERSCHRYAAGSVRPPAYFLRALLRSDQGKQFLESVMAGADPEWWREFKRAERIAVQIDLINLS